MKICYFSAAILAAMVLISCDSEKDRDEVSQQKSASFIEKGKLMDVRRGIDSLTAKWEYKNPIFNGTRIDQQSNNIPTIDRGKLTITEADLAGAYIGKKFGPWGAIIGAAAMSAIAYATNDAHYKSEGVEVDWNIPTEKYVVFGNESVSTLADSIGFYHNQIIRKIGYEKLLKTDIDDIYTLVITTARNLYGIRAESFPVNQLKEDMRFKFLKNNMVKIVDIEDVDHFCSVMEENNVIKKEDMSVFKSYIKGLKVVDNSNGLYSGDVLDYIEKSDINISTKENLKSGILVGNASQRLWSGK